MNQFKDYANKCLELRCGLAKAEEDNVKHGETHDEGKEGVALVSRSEPTTESKFDAEVATSWFPKRFDNAIKSNKTDIF